MAYIGPCTGFEEPLSVLELMGIRDIGSGTVSVTTEQCHRNSQDEGGDNSIKLTPTAGIGVSVDGSDRTHMHIKIFVPPDGDPSFRFMFNRDGEINSELRIMPNRSLAIIMGFDVLARSAGVLRPGWQLLEFDVDAKDSGIFQVWTNRSVSPTLTTGVADCQWSPLSGFDEIVMRAGVGNIFYLDDMIIADHTTGRATREWYIPQVRPNANGTPLDLTPVGSPNNFANVNEVGDPNFGTFNKTTTAGLGDFYANAPAPWTPQNILAVAPLAVVSRDGTITQARMNISSGGTGANGTYATVGAAGSPTVIQEIFTLDPDTGVPFADITAVNNVTAGPQFN